jgi:hypothetical protein
VEHGVSSDLDNPAAPTLPFAAMPQKSISRKAEEKQGLTARNWLVLRFDPEIHPFGPATFESPGKKLETRLDLTL